MATYRQYAEASGLTVLQTKQAVKQLFSDHRRIAIRHEPRGFHKNGHKEEPVEMGTCGVITASGRRCDYPARYENEEGHKVCGIHRQGSYHRSKIEA